jgi:hypothetical protein
MSGWVKLKPLITRGAHLVSCEAYVHWNYGVAGFFGLFDVSLRHLNKF